MCMVLYVRGSNGSNQTTRMWDDDIWRYLCLSQQCGRVMVRVRVNFLFAAEQPI